jgi:hypothetical protein
MIFDRNQRHHVAGLFSPPARVRFKSTPAVPTPATPQATGQAQTQSNVDTAVANATLGNIDTSGPLSSTNFTQNGTTDVDGNMVPSFAESTTLSPTLQSILTGTENTGASLIPTAQTLANQAGTSATTPLNFSGANQNIISAGPQALNSSVTNQVFQGENALLQPQEQQQQQQLQDQLSMQGIPVGSTAYGNAETQLGTQQNQENTAAAGNAAGIGATDANNMFNLAVLGQNQQIGQQQTAQSNPLSLLSQLFSTGTTSPGATA